MTTLGNRFSLNYLKFSIFLLEPRGLGQIGCTIVSSIHRVFVVYFDQHLGAASTQKLVETYTN